MNDVQTKNALIAWARELTLSSGCDYILYQVYQPGDCADAYYAGYNQFNSFHKMPRMMNCEGSGSEKIKSRFRLVLLPEFNCGEK
jgi:hypothetical protein